MRWEALFSDLEAQFDAEQAVGLAGEVADLTRAEWGALSLADRLRGQVDRSLTCWTLDGERWTGRVTRIGQDWLVLADQAGDVLVPLAAVGAVIGLAPAAEPGSAGPLGRRLPLSVVLRGLARDRAVVGIGLRDGQRLTGTVQRVGADHVDLAVHPPDVAPRPGTVERISVGYAMVSWLRPVVSPV